MDVLQKLFERVLIFSHIVGASSAGSLDEKLQAGLKGGGGGDGNGDVGKIICRRADVRLCSSVLWRRG